MIGISVVVPLFNKEKYILRTLNSILCQTYQKFEIVVVNDGSTDQGPQLVAGLCDRRIRIIDQANFGVSHARNRAIRYATYEYIAFLDADDVWSSIYLEKVVEVLTRYPNTTMVGTRYTSDFDLIEQSHNALRFNKISNYFTHAIKNTLFSSSSTVIRKDFFRFNSGFNERLKSGEDLDLWFRVVLSGATLMYILNTLVYYSRESNVPSILNIRSFKHRFVYHARFLYFDDSRPLHSVEFHRFLSKFIYSGLYQFYCTNDEAVIYECGKIFQHIQPRYLLADLYYYFPFFFRFRKLSRKYFKFIFRIIYRHL